MSENESPQFFHWMPHKLSTDADAERLTLFPKGFTGFWRSGEEMPPAN
jgi:hypothetical protein